MTLHLQGQTALVTGGAGGLGRAIVQALLDLGASVTFTARSLESREQTLTLFEGLDVSGVICDITDRKALGEVMQRPFDILINNAATIEPIGRITDIAPDAFAKAMQVNVTAQFDAVQLALPHMLAKGRGSIVNISSGAAHAPKEGWSAYCVSKAGLAMLTQAIHHEYGDLGIRCFGIAPGVVDTEMQTKIRASGINPVSKLARSDLSPPQEPAKAVAWLCTQAADALIGKELTIRDASLRQKIGLPPLN